MVKTGLFHLKKDVSEKDTLTQNTHTQPSCIVIAPTYQPEHEWRSIQLIAQDSCLIVLIGIYKPHAVSFKTFTPLAVKEDFLQKPLLSHACGTPIIFLWCRRGVCTRGQQIDEFLTVGGEGVSRIFTMYGMAFRNPPFMQESTWAVCAKVQEMWLYPQQEGGLEAGLNINNEATISCKWGKIRRCHCG